LHRRSNDFFLLIAEDPLFAAMGIQGGNGDPGMLDSKAVRRL
jgi:hypothetical protein